MRLGVLDVGSNTVHLVVVDVHPGGPPTPMSNWKTPLRLVTYLDDEGAITKEGKKQLIQSVTVAREMSEQFRCDELLAFATSALRSASNSSDILEAVTKKAGVELHILSGSDEARLTFLAVRRWFGWSAGRICDLDIGGGSLEISVGGEEEPEVALSVPLGASRLTHDWLRTDPPSKKDIQNLQEYIHEQLREPIMHMQSVAPADLYVGTSKTFKMLARLTGAAPSSAGMMVKRELSQPALRQLISFISRMTAADRAELEGVSSHRSHQVVAGALVAESTMRLLGVERLETCPWALREGVIFQKLANNPKFLGSYRPKI